MGQSEGFLLLLGRNSGLGMVHLLLLLSILHPLVVVEDVSHTVLELVQATSLRVVPLEGSTSNGPPLELLGCLGK